MLMEQYNKELHNVLPPTGAQQTAAISLQAAVHFQTQMVQLLFFIRFISRLSGSDSWPDTSHIHSNPPAHMPSPTLLLPFSCLWCLLIKVWASFVVSQQQQQQYNYWWQIRLRCPLVLIRPLQLQGHKQPAVASAAENLLVIRPKESQAQSHWSLYLERTFLSVCLE